ncbi:MAG: Lrp/AsnC family transcriptional regulator [Candidatus Omnitrophica bacterium]|nr:Lrp/AsnC family transcriptional regulator [Candidatus Omnitrophota bacterium]
MRELDKKIIVTLTKTQGIIKMPFSFWAKKLGISEKKLLQRIKYWKKNGLVRRFGVVLAHQKIGLRFNTLVAWLVPEEKRKIFIEEAVRTAQISHCYLRKSYPNWPYNFYTMIHASSKKQGLKIIQVISQRCLLKEYLVLPTKKELKKTKLNLAKIFAYEMCPSPKESF